MFGSQVKADKSPVVKLVVAEALISLGLAGYSFGSQEPGARSHSPGGNESPASNTDIVGDMLPKVSIPDQQPSSKEKTSLEKESHQAEAFQLPEAMKEIDFKKMREDVLHTNEIEENGDISLHYYFEALSGKPEDNRRIILLKSSYPPDVISKIHRKLYSDGFSIRNVDYDTFIGYKSSFKKEDLKERVEWWIKVGGGIVLGVLFTGNLIIRRIKMKIAENRRQRFIKSKQASSDNSSNHEGQASEDLDTDFQAASSKVSKYQISNGPQPVLKIDLKPGESFIAECGAMLQRDSKISMQSVTGKELGFTNAPLGIIKRLMVGESFYFVQFVNEATNAANLTLGPSQIGQMLQLDLSQFPDGLIGDQGSYFGSTKDVNLSITKKGGLKGAFSGLGYYQQRLQGTGDVFLFSPGAVERIDVKEGDELIVDSDAVFLWEPSVKVDLVRQSWFEAFASGEGLYVCKISGQGAFWLASRGASDEASSNSSGGVLSTIYKVFTPD